MLARHLGPEERRSRARGEELGLHPLAVEDAQHGTSGRRSTSTRPLLHRLLRARGAVPTWSARSRSDLHESERPRHRARRRVHSAAAVEKRFRDGKVQTTGLLLHALLDTIVDQYFGVVDSLGERVELLEQLVVGGDGQDYDTAIRELFELKRDLLRVRSRSLPSARCWPRSCAATFRSCARPVAGPYFQDVYDHIIRVTDEIDTFRELPRTSSMPTLPRSEPLNEVLKVLDEHRDRAAGAHACHRLLRAELGGDPLRVPGVVLRRTVALMVVLAARDLHLLPTQGLALAANLSPALPQRDSGDFGSDLLSMGFQVAVVVGGPLLIGVSRPRGRSSRSTTATDCESVRSKGRCCESGAGSLFARHSLGRREIRRRCVRGVCLGCLRGRDFRRSAYV